MSYKSSSTCDLLDTQVSNKPSPFLLSFLPPSRLAGVYSDYLCTTLERYKSFSDVSGMSMNSDVLSPLYDSTPLSCSTATNDQLAPWYVDGIRSSSDEASTAYCQSLYANSAKCDKKDSSSSSNQATCTFIEATFSGQIVSQDFVLLRNPDFAHLKVLEGGTSFHSRRRHHRGDY